MGCCPKSLDGYKVAIATERPGMIYRQISDTVLSKVKLELEPTPSDGIVLVNQSRTMRLKELTVDLLYSDRKLSALRTESWLTSRTGTRAWSRTLSTRWTS
jgi:hypothetical protein